MIPITKMRLFPMRTPLFRIPPARTEDESFNIIFYPENSTFSTAYLFLRIKKVFVRMGTVVPFVGFPKMILTSKLLSIFRALKLIPIRKPKVGNLFIDTTPFLNLLDKTFEKGSYRRPIILSKILSYFNQIKTYGEKRKTIFIYYVDISQPLPSKIYERRSWVFIHMLKQKQNQGKLPFDYVILALKHGNRIMYYLLSSPIRAIPIQRYFSILRNLKTIKETDEVIDHEDVENDSFSDKVTDVIRETEEEKPDEFIKKSVSKYIQNINKNKRNDLIHLEPLTDEQAKQLSIKSILTNVSGNKTKSEKIVSSIPPEKLSIALKNVKKSFQNEMIDEDEYKNKTQDVVFQNVDNYKINDNVNASKVLNKRKVDFERNFENDLKRSFHLLERKKSFPLKVINFKKEPIPIDPGDLEPSKYIKYTITLKDDTNKTHDVEVNIPELQPDGTFLINGEKKFLIYQIILDPIFFIKKDQAKLQSMYAAIAIHLKRTKYKTYFEGFISGYHLPLFLLMAYYLGFEKCCSLFNIKYEIRDEQPKTDQFIKMTDDSFLVLLSDRQDSKFLINSLRESKYKFTKQNILDNNTFKDAVLQYIGNRNCIYRINLVLENIMEPICLQILKNKLLPTTFEGCIEYICKELAKGRIDKRNDISLQRIRSSEVFAYQIQKLILGSYTDYMVKREHNDPDVSYYCDTKQLVDDVVNSQLMRTLENINPLEELSSLTRITPTGPGGIPDKHATTPKSRNTHPSYYGNIEPNDTPEGENVGMINQLTVQAAIDNIRGSFSTNPLSEQIGSKVLSPSTSLIPYVSSCDGSRVLISASQSKGYLPTIGEEQPLVQTGYETILASLLSDSYIKRSEVNGVVTKVFDDIIYIQDSKTKNIIKIPLEPKKLKSAQGKSALNYFKSTVRQGQKIQKGQILAEGKHVQEGIITTGCNLLTAVMGWKGYSFEDGYVISEKVAETKFVSQSFDEIEVMIDSDDIVKVISEQGKETIKGEPLLIRTSRKIETFVGLEEDEIYEGQIITKSPGGKIISLEIYPNISIKKFPVIQSQFENFKERYERYRGKFPAKFFITQTGGKKIAFNGIKIVFKIERNDSCTIGDKLTNSHGGKGVITLIEKDENMPVTPWGESIDIILNPIAIVNRMNPSCLYEMYTGLIAKFLAYKVVEFGNKKNLKALKLISDVYTSMDNTKDKILSKSIIKTFNNLSDKQYSEYIDKIVSKNYFLPIYVPAFQQPTKEMIFKTLQIVNAKPFYQLKLPEYKIKTTNPVTVGYLYVKKLEHQSAYKLSARSIGRYQGATSQPVAGAKSGGGQRIGEFDTWCMISHGAINVLKELMGPLSDDKSAKNEILSEITEHGEASYQEPKSGQTKNLFNVYLHGLMLEVMLK